MGMPNIILVESTEVCSHLRRSNACSAKTFGTICDCQVENPANFSYVQPNEQEYCYVEAREHYKG